jgi:hypothetical protein
VLKVDADEEGVGGDEGRYLVATKARPVIQRRLVGCSGYASRWTSANPIEKVGV